MADTGTCSGLSSWFKGRAYGSIDGGRREEDGAGEEEDEMLHVGHDGRYPLKSLL